MRCATWDDKFKATLQLGRVLLKEKNVNSISETILHHIENTCDVTSSSIWLFDKYKNTLIFHSTNREDLTNSIFLNVKKCQDIILLHNDGYLLINIMSRDDESIGVIRIMTERKDIEGSREHDLLLLISSFASLILDNVLLTLHVGDIHKKMIEKLSMATRYRDIESNEHMLRVSLYSKVLATHSNMKRDDVRIIEIASQFHDAGKIGIPDHILNKNGKFTPEESSVMKNHPVIGYNILNDPEDKILQMSARISLEHHERWDGGGYPKGIKGNEISLEGRIVGLVDVFDALTSKRVYKEAWSLSCSKAYILENSGTIFDPELVQIFDLHFDEIEKIYFLNQENKSHVEQCPTSEESRTGRYQKV
jgi:response regulator RpfG family c-di-GMP phosphodiesterase